MSEIAMYLWVGFGILLIIIASYELCRRINGKTITLHTTRQDTKYS